MPSPWPLQLHNGSSSVHDNVEFQKQIPDVESEELIQYHESMLVLQAVCKDPPPILFWRLRSFLVVFEIRSQSLNALRIMLHIAGRRVFRESILLRTTTLKPLFLAFIRCP